MTDRQRSEVKGQALKKLALRALREWLSSDNFRNRATVKEVFTNLATNSFGPEVGLSRDEIIRCWRENDWARIENKRLGAPRKDEHSEETLRKAHMIYNNGCQGYVCDSTWKWAESVLNERTRKHKTFVVVVSDSVFEALVSEVGETSLDGLTREELAEVLDLPKKVANQLVRHLVTSDRWEVTVGKEKGSTKRVLSKTLT